jgi:DNA-binding transcriptional ArsR family regulator
MVVLFRGGEMTSGDIADRFQCAWPTTVRHLRVLEQSGLLVQRKEGRTSRYRIAKERLHLVEDWLRWFRQPQKESVI